MPKKSKPQSYTITVLASEESVARFVEDWVCQESGYRLERSLARALSEQISMPLQEDDVRVCPIDGRNYAIDYVGATFSVITCEEREKGTTTLEEDTIANEDLVKWPVYWPEAEGPATTPGLEGMEARFEQPEKLSGLTPGGSCRE